MHDISFMYPMDNDCTVSCDPKDRMQVEGCEVKVIQRSTSNRSGRQEAWMARREDRGSYEAGMRTSPRQSRANHRVERQVLDASSVSPGLPLWSSLIGIPRRKLMFKVLSRWTLFRVILGRVYSFLSCIHFNFQLVSITAE